MKTLATLLLACCFSGAMAQSNLPECRGISGLGPFSPSWNNCLGEEIFTDGSKYVGEFKDNKWHGQGTYTRGDGAEYVGEFKNGRSNGQGTLYFPSGAKYVGEFKNGGFNGQGTYTFADGDKYVGEFKDNKRTGQGTYFFLADNQFKGDKYVGEFKDGEITGQGTYTFANGSKYVGEFKDRKFHGQGIFFLANGAVDKSGIWENHVLFQSKFIDIATFTRISTEANAFATATQVSRTEDQAKRAELEAQRKATELALAEARQAKREKAELEAQLAAVQQARVKPDTPVGPSLSVHAIVIGNSAYQGSGRLENPINDARAISFKLKRMGFRVTLVENADRNKLVSSLVKFSSSAADSDLTLFFYAGHGVQISGTNYMLPTDTNLNQIGGVPLHGISLNSVVEQFLPGKTKLVFLDACRDNPLLQVASRSVSRGLAPISVSQGTLISYATKDGSVAADGDGKNSPFTKALLQHIDDPVDIAVVLRKVRDQVMRDTDGQQQPWEYGSLSGGSLILSAIRAK